MSRCKSIFQWLFDTNNWVAYSLVSWVTQSFIILKYRYCRTVICQVGEAGHLWNGPVQMHFSSIHLKTAPEEILRTPAGLVPPLFSVPLMQYMMVPVQLSHLSHLLPYLLFLFPREICTQTSQQFDRIIYSL